MSFRCAISINAVIASDFQSRKQQLREFSDRFRLLISVKGCTTLWSWPLTCHRIDEVVDDDDFVAGLQQFDGCVTANETRTASHKHCLGIHACERKKNIHYRCRLNITKGELILSTRCGQRLKKKKMRGILGSSTIIRTVWNRSLNFPVWSWGRCDQHMRIFFFCLKKILETEDIFWRCSENRQGSKCWSWCR